MDIRTLTPDAIGAMSYNELIAIVEETNRPPGGIRSIQEIVLRSFLSPSSRILEIGTSTGVTAIEFARLTPATITAIDINPPSLAVAHKRAQELHLADRISFELQDASALAYDDGTYDLVFCGNVTSLIADRGRALREYVRVLRIGGLLAAIPMYYVRTPPTELVRQVSTAIRVDIVPRYRSDWTSFFQTPPLQPFWSGEYAFDTVSEETVDDFVNQIVSRPHLQCLSQDAALALRKTYGSSMQLFRENLSYMGFTILLLRKELTTLDPELFTAHPLQHS